MNNALNELRHHVTGAIARVILASPVSGKYGAPMGRHPYTRTLSGESIATALENFGAYLTALQGMPLRFRLQNARLDSGGYDCGGAYWGHSKDGTVYLAKSVDGRVFRSFRAHTRADAARQLRREFPQARVFGIPVRIDKRDTRYVVQRVQRKGEWLWRVTFTGANGTAFKVGQSRKLSEALRAANEFDAMRSTP